MWRWIADEIEKQGRKVKKWKYFVAMGIAKEDRPVNDCYCCEFCLQQYKFGRKGNCSELCPFNWGTGHETGYIFALCSEIKYSSNYIEAGYFRQWLDAKSPKEAAEIARIIAELPEK